MSSTKKTKYPVYDISEIDSKELLEMYENRFFKVLGIDEATSEYDGKSQLGVLYDKNVDSFINDAFKYANLYFNKVSPLRNKSFNSGIEELKYLFMKIKSKYPNFEFSKKNAMFLALELVNFEGNNRETAAFNKTMGNIPSANLWDTYNESFDSFPEINSYGCDLITEISYLFKK